MTSDPELAARAELESMFREHYAALVAFASRFVRDSDEAEELVQDVFLALWRRREDMPPASSARAYLFRAVHNRALNVIRHARIKRRAAEEERAAAADVPPSAESADSAALVGETERLVRDAIARLPERCRAVFQLSREDGLSYAEIASVLGISVKTVETQMGRALRFLRSELAPLIQS